MKKLKVFGGNFAIKGKQVRAIIACEYKNQAIAKLGISYNNFRNFWCKTGNEKELEVGLSTPYTIFYCDINSYEKYKEYRKE